MAATFGLVDGGSAIIAPGFVLAANYQLTHHLTSSLQWKAGADSFMKGGLHFDNQTVAVSTSLQVNNL